MATADGIKTGGRRPGALNLKTKFGPKAEETAKRLGVDPFEILLLFASNDWKALGYNSATREVATKGGGFVEVDTIQPIERIAAAKSACPYLLPTKQAIAFTDADGKSLEVSLPLLIEAMLLKKNEPGKS